MVHTNHKFDERQINIGHKIYLEHMLCSYYIHGRGEDHQYTTTTRNKNQNHQFLDIIVYFRLRYRNPTW